MADGAPSDPLDFLGEANYKYLEMWHIRRMSSTRSDYSCTKGIRGIFEKETQYDLKRCATEEALEDMKAKGAALLKGDDNS